MKIDGKIAQANARLRAARVGVSIERAGNRLRLRATLPPKPDSEKAKPHRQRISLGIWASAAGLTRAEAEARGISKLLALGQFTGLPTCENLLYSGAATTG